MTAAAWPPGLPAYVLVAGYAEDGDDDVIRFDAEYGPGKRRPRYSRQPQVVTCQLGLTGPQATTLRGLYASAVAEHGGRVRMVHPRTRQPMEMRFLAPPEIRPQPGAAGRYRASLRLLARVGLFDEALTLAAGAGASFDAEVI